MRLIFAGTSEIAVPTLELLAKNHEVLTVITKPDKKSGRGKKVVFSPVKLSALALGLTVWQPEGLKGETVENKIRNLKVEVIVNVACGFLVPKNILDLTRWGVINLHPSLLPRWRGASPLQRALLAGDAETGVSIMRMEESLDTGPILTQVKFPILAEDTSGSLMKKAGEIGSKLMLEVLANLEEIKPLTQQGETCYAEKLVKEEGRIDWNSSAESLERKIRGLNPWPGAYTFFRGKRLLIWEARIYQGKPIRNVLPGTFTTVNGLLVSTACGLLEITKLQPEGGKVIPANAWLNGISGREEREHFDET